jgi:hypothetical protein
VNKILIDLDTNQPLIWIFQVWHKISESEIYFRTSPTANFTKSLQKKNVFNNFVEHIHLDRKSNFL